ncbi:hypothetical protein NDA07_05400 [Microcoleus vaginatus DQ-U2]|uniref:hypothetical protein n=1 Tax=Microcoleus vaginatus TaxID=119532 RepID=UPI0016852ED3|nr:hypothetical protein [Microcoleus sp. FACHB-DQ6]
MSNLLCYNGQLDLLIDRPEQIELKEITAAEATVHDRQNAITPVKKRIQQQARAPKPDSHQSFPILQFFNLKSKI